MTLDILYRIADEPGSNAKMDILREYVDNSTLQKAIYLSLSPRVKFWIKKIPSYTSTLSNHFTLDEAMEHLSDIMNREVTGDAAKDHLEDILSSVNEDNAEVIKKIIQKDLKIGMNVSNVNKVFPKLIEVTPYMGAVAFNDKEARRLCKNKMISQVKMDGRYCNALIKNNKVTLLARGGEITYVGDALFLKELSKCPDAVLNGELTIDGLDRYEANGIISSIVSIEGKIGERSKEETGKKILSFEKKHGSYSDLINRIKYTVWDIISHEEYEDMESSTPYTLRLKSMNEYIKYNCLTMVSEVEWKIVDSFKLAMEHFQEIAETGGEGTVIKTLNGTWKKGKPKWQMKMKKEDYHDLKIVGFNYGTVGTKNEHVISSLDVETCDGMLRTSPGGISESDMNYITENQKDLLGSIVEVKCSGLSQNKHGEYALLHPVFIKLRDDKKVANSIEECININNMISELN